MHILFNVLLLDLEVDLGIFDEQMQWDYSMLHNLSQNNIAMWLSCRRNTSDTGGYEIKGMARDKRLVIEMSFLTAHPPTCVSR